jgi:alpha-tubulin suppressor-like RCC1 family protein
MELSGLDDVAAIAGGLVQGYALLTDGTVWSWGYGISGELGNGLSAGNQPKDSCEYEETTNRKYCSSVPVGVKGLNDVIAIAGGYYEGYYGDGYALLSSGTVWDWGAAVVGQLGNGYSAADPHATNCDSKLHLAGKYCSSVPVEVTGLSGVQSIGAGYAATTP